jgi:tetratricopeptide (TPR) repeat protein
VAADLERAQAALRAHDAAAAQKLFAAILQLDPGNAEAHANLGVMAFFHGDCAAAEPHFRAALRAQPSLIKMKALLSVCEKQLGQPSAQADMESAFQQLQDPVLRERLGIELANLDYQRGELERTAGVLQTLLTLEPDNVDVLFFAQRVYSELADQTLNKLAVLAPGSARMEQLIAERLINAGDLKDAARHYEEALQLDPRLPGVHFELAETLLQASPGDSAVVAQATQQLEDAIKIDGDSANVECKLAQIALQQGHTQQGLADYRRAYELNPRSAEAQMGMATILERAGKDEQAAAYLRMAVAAEPFNDRAHYRLFEVDKRLHLNAEADAQLKLFVAVRAASEKVRQLYREMNPNTAAPGKASIPNG